MQYEWDEKKRQANIIKHGVDFTEIERFEWDAAIVGPDLRRNYYEPGFIAVGNIDDRLYVVVFTMRESSTRIIGLRKANEREVKKYEAQKAQTH
ncbi:MAG: BrnT family toxin [Dissulfurispiraceae bacterium]